VRTRVGVLLTEACAPQTQFVPLMLHARFTCNKQNIQDKGGKARQDKTGQNETKLQQQDSATQEIVATQGGPLHEAVLTQQQVLRFYARLGLSTQVLAAFLAAIFLQSLGS
jgi:hypothetical protein